MDKIPQCHNETQKNDEDKFQILQGENQIHSKINDMIINSKKKKKKTVVVIENEKELVKFYQADFLEILDKSPVEHKILTNSSEKISYIFDELDKINIKKYLLQ